MPPSRLIPSLERQVLRLKEGMAGVKLVDMAECYKKSDNLRLYIFS
jgi:hypothetical protein